MSNSFANVYFYNLNQLSKPGLALSYDEEKYLHEDDS